MTKMNIRLEIRNYKGKNGYPIRLTVYYNDRLYSINTGIFTPDPNNFVDGVLSKSVPNSKVKNLKLGEIRNAVERYTIDYNPRPGKDLAFEKKILEIVTGKKQVTKSFIDYLDEFVSLKSNEGTKSVYGTTRNKIVEFDRNCTFDTMDRKWLTSFENWMAETMKINAYAIHLRNIRAVFNYAIDEEFTTLYPFRKFQIRKEETKKRSLNVEQLRTLRDYPVEKHQERYRDMFILMVYLIGINAADLFRLKEITPEGRIEYYRAKTHKFYSIKVEPEAMEIINKYRGQEYLLNIMDDYSNYKDFLHRMDIALKQIGEVERIGRGGKKCRTPLFPALSSYWSRHTWATFAAALDTPKETISAALGHNIGSDVTSIYIKFDLKKVDDANRRVIDYMNKNADQQL